MTVEEMIENLKSIVAKNPDLGKLEVAFLNKLSSRTMEIYPLADYISNIPAAITVEIEKGEEGKVWDLHKFVLISPRINGTIVVKDAVGKYKLNKE